MECTRILCVAAKPQNSMWAESQDRRLDPNCDSFISIDQISGNGLRPRRPRVQTAALLRRFNLDVAKQNRAACFHDLGGANAAEDAINKTHAVDNCTGETGF